MNADDVIKELERALKTAEDLINRQHAELIEERTRRKNAVDAYHEARRENERLQKHNTEMAFKHHRDGAKEFAERLCQISKWLPLTCIQEPFVTLTDIDNLLEELEKGGAE